MQLTTTCDSLLKLLKKDTKIEWINECQAVFNRIKWYLLNLPILVPPMLGHPLILYLTVQETSMGCMLGRLNESDQKEKAIYYLSKKFTSCEINYITIENTCCALAWASHKLRQYMLYFTMWLTPSCTSLKSLLPQGRSPVGRCCYLRLILCLWCKRPTRAKP